MNNMRKLLLQQREMQNTLAAFDEHLLFALERRYFDFLQPDRLELCRNPAQGNFDFRTDLRVIRMDEVSHEGESDRGLHLMHFQNVLASMKDDSHNVISLIHGDGLTSALYYGIAKRREKEGILGTDQYARMLGQCIHGNFLGARFASLNGTETQSRIIMPLLEHKNILALPGIPSLRDANGPYVQGIDRFIEAMRGEKFILLCIAEPITLPVVDGMIKNLFDLSSSVHSYVKTAVQKMRGSSDTLNIGMFGMKGVMDSVTDSEATTDGSTSTDGRTQSESSGVSRLGRGGGVVAGLTLAGAILGSFIPIPGVGTAVGAMIGTGIGGLIGTGIGGLTASATGMPMSSTTGETSALSNATATMHSFTRSVANTAGSMMGGGGFGGYARGWNRSSSASQEILNKTAEYCEKLCDTYIKRLQRGKNLGFWNVGVYLMSSDKYTQMRGQGLLRACLAGDETHWEPIRALPIQDEAAMAYLVNFNNPQYNLLRYGTEKLEVKSSIGTGMKLATVAKQLFNGSIERLYQKLASSDEKNSTAILEKIRRTPAICSQEALDKAWAEIEAANLGHPLGPALGGIGTPLNTEELSIAMNLPRREVQGITLRESSAFGINYRPPVSDQSVDLGHLVHKRQVQHDIPFTIPRNLFQKHAFICGVTGSGKTNTCFSVLDSLDLPFLIIEPAKSEYRQLLGKIPELRIYTLGLETISPFRLNPFEFPPGGNLLAHIDSLKAVFNSSFPMYGPMPYILEEAIIDVYTDKGWDLATSGNIYLQKMPNARFHDYLPTLQELYNKIESVVAEKQYAQELTLNIGAALKARLASLLTGSKGLMLDTLKSVPLGDLLQNKVLLELKHIGDDEEKCFLMGLLLTQIYEYREVERASGSPLRHIILIEEAHRLLRRVPDYVSPEVGNSRGKAVETFSNVISEIRDFGEGLIVVDQIPAKLTSDVIKNTTIKIVHRTLAIDDREMVGGTMGLTVEQSKELPLLPVGQAVIHSEGSDKPFLVQIRQCKGIGEVKVQDETIAMKMEPIHQANADIFRRYPGFEKKPGIRAAYYRMEFRRFYPEIYMVIIAASALIFEKDSQLAVLKTQAAKSIQNIVRIDESVEIDCHIIWNTHRFFEKLNDAFPRTVDHCLSAQQSFIDIWFSDNNEEVIAGTFAHEMAAIVRKNEPLIYIMKIFIRQEANLTGFILSLKPDDFKTKTEQINQALTEFLSRRLMVDKISLNFKNALLRAILENSPQHSIALEQFTKALQEAA